VNEAGARSATSPRLWFAVAGAPVAWGLQFGIGYWISQTHCDQAAGGWTDAAQAWVVVLTVVAALVALAGGLTALGLYRATREVDHEDGPPGGRTHFLSIVGMAITPLFLFIIVMNGVGVNVLSPCHPS
jgi:heme/copper-type cytochrome/quinol oxidase subunit 2